MGHPHAVRKVPPDGGQQDQAVTPVIGAVLILGISVLGIAGVLFWGAPTIERIQAGNAQTAIVGEFEDLRDSSRELSVPDHSRFPTVVLPRGELGIGQGSHIMVTSNHDVAGCEFHITGWVTGTATAHTDGCTAGTTTSVYRVSGQSQVLESFTEDFLSGDWLFRLTTAGGTVVAEAWLIDGDRIEWNLGSEAGERSVYLDSGAIFSDTAGTLFLEKSPAIGDVAFGSDYYGLWLRSLTAGSFAGVEGSGSYQVYLSLIGNYLRTDQPSVYSVRYDIAGDLAEAWCNAFLMRNADLPALASYDEVSGFECDDSDEDAVRAVLYTNGGSTFTFRFLHARIYASLAI
jgi:hypothetical protein